jgi:hypothetical protein
MRQKVRPTSPHEHNLSVTHKGITMKSEPENPQSISAKLRGRRVQWFVQRAESCGLSNAHLLDIGGTIDYWEMNARYVPDGLISNIDIVNLPPAQETTRKTNGMTLNAYIGDALDSSTLRQKQYDVVYSNSVIEHVGNLRSQHQMAAIIQDTGKYYWIQTPAKSFPIEPHFYFPFFPYLPLGLRAFLHQRFTMGFVDKEPDWIQARIECEDTRILTGRELRHIFKGCELVKERVFGMCKSYTATNMELASGLVD